MRNRRIIGGLAVAAAVAVGVTGVAIGAPAVQSLDVQVGGKAKPKLSKKKFKKSSLEAKTSIVDGTNPAGIPPKATKAVLKFDKKDVKFDTKAAPGCDPNAIENTTTQDALAKCGQAKVGQGSAVASLAFGGARQDVPATVTAFNRSDSKGILLHSRVDSLGTTVVLRGTLKGATLSVDIPPLAGGSGAISEFSVKVKKGKYVQARCSDKKLVTKSNWTYSDAPSVSVKSTQKCKGKK